MIENLSEFVVKEGLKFGADEIAAYPVDAPIIISEIEPM